NSWLTMPHHYGRLNPGQALRMSFPPGSPPKHMLRGQHPNSGPPSERLRNVAPQIKPDQGSGLSTGIDWRPPHQRPGLGTKPERTCRFGEIERLNAVGITDKPQFPFSTIPERHGVHAA